MVIGVYVNTVGFSVYCSSWLVRTCQSLHSTLRLLDLEEKRKKKESREAGACGVGFSEDY